MKKEVEQLNEIIKAVHNDDIMSVKQDIDLKRGSLLSW